MPDQPGKAMQSVEGHSAMGISIQVHKSVRIFGDVYLGEPARIYADVLLDNTVIGAFSYIANRTILHYVSIGRYSSIGDNVSSLSDHPIGSLTTAPFPYEKVFLPPFDPEPMHSFDKLSKIEIGNDVWIGAGVKLMPGICIGDGAVIAAGAVVTKDVAPYQVVGGVPARVIKSRFSDAIIARLLELRWWDYEVMGKPIDWTAPEVALDWLEAEAAAGCLPRVDNRWFKISAREDGHHGDLVSSPL